MRSTFRVVVALILTCTVAEVGQAEPGGLLLQTAAYQEETVGDLDAAIAIYEEIIKAAEAAQPHLAQAHYRLATCYLKKGQNDKAAETLRRLIERFHEQKDVVAAARKRLADLGRATPDGTEDKPALVTRRVWQDALDTEGAPSPDGRYLSFVDWDTGDLAVRDLTTGENRRLTNKGTWSESSEFAMYSVFSPDGKQIAYAWYNDKERRYELRVIGANGESPRVAYTNQTVSYLAPMGWSTDGRDILVLFNRVRDTSQIALVSAADGTARVVKTFDARGSARINDSKISLSPDGRYIVYDLAAGDDPANSDIFLMSADGSHEAPLVRGAANEVNPIWCPDGKHVLFFGDRTGSLSAWLIRVVEGKPEGDPPLVRENIGRAWPMGFTSDGTLFYSLRTAAPDVFVADLDPQTGRVVGTPASVNKQRLGTKSSPAWSPDGRHLAYAWQGPLQTDWGRTTIVVRSMETGQEREISTGDMRSVSPVRWSGDGRFLVALMANKPRGTFQIGRIDRQTGAVAHLAKVEAPNFLASPKLLPDGKRVFYLLIQRDREEGPVRREMHLEMHLVEIETGEDTKIDIALPPLRWVEGFTDQGQWVICSDPDVDAEPSENAYAQRRTLRLLDLERGEEKQLVAGTINRSVSPDGRWLAFVRPGEGEKADELTIMPSTGGPSRRVFEPSEGNRIRIIGWSPGGESLYFGKLLESSPGAAANRFHLWWRAPSEGGEAVEVGGELELSRNPNQVPVAFRPDGRKVAFQSGQNKSEVWAMENFLPAAGAQDKSKESR